MLYRLFASSKLLGLGGLLLGVLLLLGGEARPQAAQAALSPGSQALPAPVAQQSVGDGRRVYISGIKSSGAPFFAWTENIYAASPTWQENSAGLPASVDSGSDAGGPYQVLLTLDPRAPSERGWITLRRAGSMEIYRNDALRSDGTWTKIFDVVTHNAVTGRSETAIDIHGRWGYQSHGRQVMATVAEPGLIGMVVHIGWGATPYYVWAYHSHDYGTTWTAVNILNGVGEVSGGRNFSFVIGQHDANRMYLVHRDGFTNFRTEKSTDGGHSFTGQNEPDTAGNGVYLPYENNPNDDIVLRPDGGSLWRSTDGGANYTLWGTGINGGYPFELIQADGGFGIDGLHSSFGSGQALKTTDGGQTWVGTTFNFSHRTQGLALLKLGYYYTCSWVDGNEVIISSDWVNFTNKNGNLHTVLGANPDCFSIAPDPSPDQEPLHYDRTDTTAFALEPVNVVSGHFVLDQRDLIIPGRGVPLGVERSYNSADATDRGLGVGWAHAFGMKVTPETGSALVLMENGRPDRYADAGGGNYTPPTGVHNRLVKNADNTWTLTKPNQLVYSFDTAGKLTSVKDRNNNTTTLSYDASNRLTTVTDPGGRSLTFSYNANNRVSQVSDPLGRTVSYAYNAAGDLTGVTDLRGGVTTMSYDASHRLLTLVDPLNRTAVSNTYDASGRVSEQRDARNNLSTFAYDAVNLRTTVTDPRGNATIYQYDDAKRVTKETDALGSFVQYSYDANNNRTAVRDKRGNTTNYSYDANGNVLTITDPLSNTTSFTYNGFNDPLTKSDALGRVTTFAYDVPGNLTSITDALGKVTSFSYDTAGNLTATTDANNQTTAFGYDQYGNRTAITDPLGKTTSLAFDLGGRLTSRTDPLNHTTSFAYNNANQLTSATDALNHTTSFAYDAAGNKTSVTDANGKTTSYEYDANNNLTSVTDALTQTTSYAYDANNNRTSLTDAESRVTSFSYDAVGNRTSITDANTKTTSFGYDQYGNRTSLLDAKGQSTSFAYDANNRLTTITYPGPSTVTYSYDNADRLTSVTYPGPSTTTYTYSPTGNRLTKAEGTTTNYTYDAADRMTSAGGVTYGYDNNGNQTSRGSDTFSYDAANRLTQAVIGNTTTTYTYNGDGVRVSKRVGNNTTSYVVDSNRSLPVVLHDGEAFYLYGLDLIARITTSGNPAQRQRYYHYDGLGSTRALTDTNGNTSATYDYDVFGAISSSTGNITNDFRYTGEQRDAESEYYFLRARYYDPGIGRFITRDPVSGAAEAPQSLNAYVYVTNNATNRVDPSGLVPAPPLLPRKQPLADIGDIVSGIRGLCSKFLGGCWGGGTGPVPIGPSAEPSGVATVAKAAIGPIAGVLTGLSKHGLDQIIQRGIRPYEIIDTLRNPVQVVQGRGDVIRYIGRWAELRLNALGEVVTAIRFKPPTAP